MNNLTAKNHRKRSNKTKKTILCEIEGCKKRFKNATALQNHRLNKHQNIYSPVQNEAMESTNMAKNRGIKCNFECCKRQFKNAKALEDHQSAKHRTTQPVSEEKKLTFTTTESKEVKKRQNKMCDFHNCNQSFKKQKTLQRHQIENHPIKLRCPFSEECLNSNEMYIGIINLQNHVLLEHANTFSQIGCPITNCNMKKQLNDWSAILEHTLQRHAKYLLE